MSLRSCQRLFNAKSFGGKFKPRGFHKTAFRAADLEIKDESNGIRHMLLNRPRKNNALSTEMFTGMTESLYESNGNSGVKIICIKGTGSFFSAGYDIQSLIEDHQNDVPFLEMGFAKLTRALIDCEKPIVAIVNGHAVGIGVTMLAHCEAVYASESATFNSRLIKMGIPPECCSSYLLPKIMGHAKAGALLQVDSKISAQEAYECNLVTKVFPEAQLESEASKLVNKMADHPLQSLVNSKQLLRSRERELLHKVHREETAKIDVALVADAVMKFMSRK